MTTKEQITEWFCKRNKIKKEVLNKYHRYAIAITFQYVREEVEPLLEKYGDVENVPEKAMNE